MKKKLFAAVAAVFVSAVIITSAKAPEAPRQQKESAPTVSIDTEKTGNNPVIQKNTVSAATKNPTPAVPQTSTEPKKEASNINNVPGWPSRLIIPSISLNADVEALGVNDKGEMDVPSVENTAGWYKYGTLPGNVGSAVMDAHVYMAFKNLHKVSLGDDIFVQKADGSKLHFVVSEIKVYPLAETPAELLFNRADSRRLNLITCAGTWTADRSTYTHRLIVFAELKG